MTREETKEAIKVMQAYVDGKAIEFRNKNSICNDNWVNTGDTVRWNFFACDYRIKPEPTYRPYDNAKELYADIQKHGG